MKRTVLVGLAGIVGCFAVLGFAAASPAQAAGCSKKDVTVVVQFPDHTSVGCAAGNPVTGYAALKGAGFPITYATGNGTGAICSIGGYPGHACSSMPSQNAYWAYFHAEPGGSWTYSDEGGGSYDPAPGTVEGWRFGDGSAPSGRAPALAVSKPTPKPTPTSKPSGKPTKKPAATGTPTATPTGTSTAGATPTRGPSSTPTATPTTISTGTLDTASPSPTGPTVVAGAKNDKSSDDSSSGGLSWIWAPVLLGFLGVAGAATYVARRRG